MQDAPVCHLLESDTARLMADAPASGAPSLQKIM
jgi:hypothetical protein